MCRWRRRRSPPFPRLRPEPRPFPAVHRRPGPSAGGGPSRASPAPVGFITCLLGLLEPPLLLCAYWTRAASPRPATRRTPAGHARVLPSTLPFTARAHTHPRSHSSPSHTRASHSRERPPGTRAHTFPLTPHSRPGALALQGRAGTAGESAEGTHGLPMADLSFIEDSVAFPEKEEDEEEEEEGVEWGYEEGNPPRARRLALPAPPPPLFPTWVPGPFRGSRSSGQSGRRPRASPGARPWCLAAVGTCRRPVGEPEGCVGDSSVRLVARRAALAVTEHLENAALLKLLFSFFEKKFFGLQSCVSLRCTAK